MSRHKESFFQRKLLDSSAFSSLSCLLGVFCCEHHRPAGLSNTSLLVHLYSCSSMASPAHFEAFPASPSLCVVLPMENITAHVIFVKPFSSMSHCRFHVGPSCRLLPALHWLQRGRGPEIWVRLPLRHSVHHLRAAQPVSSSSLCHALPSTLRLLSLYENHLSKRLGEELHLTQNRQKQVVFL